MDAHYLRMKDGYLPVKGKIFEFEGEQFIAHKSIGSGYGKDGRYGGSGKYYVYYSGYGISHLKTGVIVWRKNEADTRKNMIAGLPDYLSRQLRFYEISLPALIAETVELHGLTPEFDKTKEPLILKDKIVI